MVSASMIIKGCVRLVDFVIDHESDDKVIIRKANESGKYSRLTLRKVNLITNDHRGIHIRYNRYQENKWFFGECK